jgi:glucosamine-6-phosphate deaminase
MLKLTARDYAEHQLVARRARRLGRPSTARCSTGSARQDSRPRKLPRTSVCICFSPHPDDDVISMGGILRKLWENENEVVVAYMTSGNIAVFDHDVTRHLDFVERAAAALGIDAAVVQRARGAVDAGVDQKAPGDIDIPVVQNLKKFIRESEAIAALAAVGIPPSAARFLDLPFYQTGEVRKRPLSDNDVAIVLKLIEDARPDLVFVAGDLSDPHGTHRTCKAAVEQALARYQAAQRPEVWLYRGAWQEWSLTDADVLVPLSQDELHAKILAIFRHQSQKDTAPFPGYDEREFWQRVEARNLETAARADRLGMPEYYAMEAYVIQGA